MHDYNSWAVLAFAALSLVLGTALMFVLAWIEPAARVSYDTPERGKSVISPVSLPQDVGMNPIMKVARDGLATG